MRTLCRCTIAGAALLLTISQSLAGDLEKWADSKLPARDGLVFWLDASRMSEAWQAHGKAVLYPGATLDVWYDASGNGVHFAQQVKDVQPKYVPAGNRAAVRFDGTDDFFGASPSRRTLDTFTAFVVAAPRSNAGGFRAFLAGQTLGLNDYMTGFTIDLNGYPGDRFGQLNVEGRGFGGAVNLMTQPLNFGDFHTVEVTCQAGDKGVNLFIDGHAQGNRRRDADPLGIEALFLGARCFSNSPEPPTAAGFLDGDIAEVLLYDRVLNDMQRAAVRDYLTQKHAGLAEAIAGANRQGGKILKPIDNPPLVQMLVPGFSVRTLPIELNNINNLRYRPDGKLLALGYDGNIHLLSDTDGDGLEDHIDPFWKNDGQLRGPIGIALTPPGYEHGNGLFVASKGKVSLIVDTDGDDRADREIVVASGWSEITQNVDAIGVALAPDGSLYFGLGTANYANGYLLEPDGKARYDITSERGTVLRVSKDFKSREIIATGTRFPVSMAFHPNGDLFCTDQEGATWLPNGNPFDELLHIQRGRHYGFPPRHPRHLPNVIDEPSVYDFGPQHQSTCGMLFNIREGGPTFGPAAWTGSAIVCGESRGKLYRVQLSKTSDGYLAHNDTIACLGMLTVDACLAPTGDLVVACHSGPPDWGTGPQGKGKLFKIRYSDPKAPQPVAAWAASPREVRVAFDRPLDATRLKNIASQVAIESGPYVRPGDRFETLKPPYAVVQRQNVTPRFDVPVNGVQISADGRTLVLATGPHSDAANFSVTLPAFSSMTGSEKSTAASERRASASREIQQIPAIDVGYDLTGVSAAWQPTRGDGAWTGWLPHLDLATARAWTAGSAEHDALWEKLTKAGTLTLATQLDLWNLLRPAIQPGSSIDWTPPPEQVRVRIRSSARFQVRSSVAKPAVTEQGGEYIADLSVVPQQGELMPLEVSLATGRVPKLEISFHTNEDERERVLATRRFLLPWASVKPPKAELAVARTIPQLQGGDWQRGRAVYFSEEALCSKCHKLRGAGGNIGPDLANLPQRDYDSVLRDVTEPSAAINPDHINYSIAMRDGRVLTGVPIASDANRIVFGDNTGKEVEIARKDIEELKPSSVSGMPADIAKKLGPEKLRDLITFLMTEPLSPATLVRRDVPPPRRRAELEPLWRQAAAATASNRPLHIVLATGPKDHGPDEHDYPLWQTRWSKLLSLADNVTISTADAWPSREQWDKANIIVFFSANPAWSADKARDLDAFLGRGGGLVFIHYAVNGGSATEALAERIGLATAPGLKFRHGPLDLQFSDPQHPITAGFESPNHLDRVSLVDESYWDMVGDIKRIHVLASSIEDGQPRPQVWTVERGAGRVFVSIPGHYTWTFDDPIFRTLLLRGILWTAKEPPDRLRDLVTIGARME
jgi:putative heme-binding domain-containing protein